MMSSKIVKTMTAKNMMGEEIEVTEDVLQVNLDQIEHYLDAALRFEQTNDMESRDLYLNEAIKIESVIEILFSPYSSEDRTPVS